MLRLAEVADHIENSLPQILKQWRDRVDADPQVGVSSRLSLVQFNDHIPVLLAAFCARLRHGDSPRQENEEREASEAHGRHRWQQGYDLRAMVREWGHLNATLVVWLDQNSAPASARTLWAEFLAFNESEAVALYENLLQGEARAKLRDVEHALEELQSWEKARGDLLRQASHDLRGGLTVVASASSLLGSHELNDEQRAQFATLLGSGVRNVTNMMSDLLDMARLEAGVEQREIRATDVGALLSSLSSTWKLLAEQKGLHFEMSGPQALLVEGDGTKIRRIVQNLVLNAIKYTAEGEVRVTWGEAGEQQWFAEIADTGAGLQKSSAAPVAQDLESVAPNGPPSDFQPESLKISPNGEGIGLAIVRRLCELLEASIELHSTDEGSTFRVTFPREYDTR